MSKQDDLIEELDALEQTIDAAMTQRRSVERRAGQYIAARLVDAGIYVSTLAKQLNLSHEHTYSMLNGNKRMTLQHFRDCLAAIRRLQFP